MTLTRHNERMIARAVIQDAIAAGYTVDVFDSEEITLKASTDLGAILGAMFTSDDDKLILRRADSKGWVWFIYGNGNNGCDVITDYTCNLDSVVERAMEIAEKLSEEN